MTAGALPQSGAAIADSSGAAARATRRTIRGRLLTGLGGATGALLATGVLSVHTISLVGRELRRDVRATAEVTEQLSRSHDATLRSLLLVQGALMQGGAAAGAADVGLQLARADSLSGVADSLRQAIVTGASIRGEDRASVEQIGRLQGQLEVRLAVARAYQNRDGEVAAVRQIRLASASLDTLLALSTALSVSQRERAGSALGRIDDLVAWRRLVLAAMLALGLTVAVVVGVQTWRAVARPLTRLTEVARALGGGDLRVTLETRGLDDEY
ncbi:MAG: hypothetical protein ACREON_18525, partial [Gemmatimonadaceae bacterium]